MLISFSIVLFLAVTAVTIQSFKENQKEAFNQKAEKNLFLTTQNWLID